MTKVFISQPMRGKTDDEILKAREKAKEAIKEYHGDEIQILDSYFADYDPENGCVPLKYLAKSLEILADADIAYFIKGWQDARGCRIENECAIEYGITVIEDYSESKEERRDDQSD